MLTTRLCWFCCGCCKSLIGPDAPGKLPQAIARGCCDAVPWIQGVDVQLNLDTATQPSETGTATRVGTGSTNACGKQAARPFNAQAGKAAWWRTGGRPRCTPQQGGCPPARQCLSSTLQSALQHPTWQCKVPAGTGRGGRGSRLAGPLRRSRWCGLPSWHAARPLQVCARACVCKQRGAGRRFNDGKAKLRQKRWAGAGRQAG